MKLVGLQTIYFQVICHQLFQYEANIHFSPLVKRVKERTNDHMGELGDVRTGKDPATDTTRLTDTEKSSRPEDAGESSDNETKRRHDQIRTGEPSSSGGAPSDWDLGMALYKKRRDSASTTFEESQSPFGNEARERGEQAGEGGHESTLGKRARILAEVRRELDRRAKSIIQGDSDWQAKPDWQAKVYRQAERAERYFSKSLNSLDGRRLWESVTGDDSTDARVRRSLRSVKQRLSSTKEDQEILNQLGQPLDRDASTATHSESGTSVPRFDKWRVLDEVEQRLGQEVQKIIEENPEMEKTTKKYVGDILWNISNLNYIEGKHLKGEELENKINAAYVKRAEIMDQYKPSGTEKGRIEIKKRLYKAVAGEAPTRQVW